MTKFVTESMGEKSPEAGESLNQFHELLTTPLARRPLSQHIHGYNCSLLVKAGGGPRPSITPSSAPVHHSQKRRQVGERWADSF